MIEVKGKKISVVGAARSGVGAAKLIKRLGGIPFVSDFSPEEKIKESFKKLYNTLFEGPLIRCDFFVVDGEQYSRRIGHPRRRHMA